MHDPIIASCGLTKVFGEGASQVRAVDQVSLDISPGQIVLITGPSGSGKTTLLSMLGALLSPTAGTVHVDGTNITGLPQRALARLRARKLGFIFQAFNLLEALSVEDNILLPAQLAPGGVAAARARAEALIERVGLDHRRRSRPGTLSGGEKQRVAIARALVNRPPIIMADEPTGNLDSHRGQEVMMLLHDIARDDGCAVLIVTHDPRVEDIADRILWLEDGRLRDRRAEPHEWVRDPVCGMRVDAWTAVARSSFDGQTYVFCTSRCKDRFDGDPHSFFDPVEASQP